VYGVTEHVDVPLQDRSLHWSSLHTMDVPLAQAPLALHVSL
jgi:hypothetical protein